VPKIVVVEMFSKFSIDKLKTTVGQHCGVLQLVLTAADTQALSVIWCCER